MPGPSVPSDRKLVQALHVSDEPGMRKLIVGMLTKDAWDGDPRDGQATPADLETSGEPDIDDDELTPANIKAVLRWTFDIDLRD